MRPAQVTIIVLNWNGGEITLACLDSLGRLDYPSCEIVVVDNGSKDGSVSAIRAQFPQITLIEAGENLGFAAGNNLGLEYARKTGAEYALLLNNDTEVAPEFLSLLVEAAEADPHAGVAGPLIYYYSDPQVIWSAGGMVDWQHGRTRMVGMGETDQKQFGGPPRPVDFVTGCAFLIKMQVYALTGGLDPRFFAYYEENEWCVRIRQAGYHVLFVPAAKIWHKISPAARDGSPQVHYYMTRNRLLFLQCARAGWRAWFSVNFENLRTLASWTLNPAWRHKAPQRRAMLRAILDFWRRRFGKVSVS